MLRRILPYIFYVAVIIGLIVAIVFAFRSNGDDKPQNKPTTTSLEQQKAREEAQKKTQQAKQQSDEARQKAADAKKKAEEAARNKTAQDNGSTPGSATNGSRPNYTAPSSGSTGQQGTSQTGQGATGQTPQPSGTPATDNGKLSESGPGETLAVFAATVAISYFGYTAYQRRQLS